MEELAVDSYMVLEVTGKLLPGKVDGNELFEPGYDAEDGIDPILDEDSEPAMTLLVLAADGKLRDGTEEEYIVTPYATLEVGDIPVPRIVDVEELFEAGYSTDNVESNFTVARLVLIANEKLEKAANTVDIDELTAGIPALDDTTVLELPVGPTIDVEFPETGYRTETEATALLLEGLPVPYGPEYDET